MLRQQLNDSSWKNIKNEIRKCLGISPEQWSDADLEKAIYEIFLCVGYKECLTVEELNSLILYLEKNGLSYNVYLVPKTEEDLSLWKNQNQETLEIMKNPPQNPNEWRTTEKWLAVKKKLEDFLSGDSEEQYVQFYQQNMKNDYQKRYNNKQPSEGVIRTWAQEAKNKYQLARTDILNTYDTEVKSFHKKHPQILEDEIKTHIFDETVDWLFTGQKGKPAIILYKYDLFKTMNKAKSYADKIGCSSTFLCKPKIKFENLPWEEDKQSANHAAEKMDLETAISLSPSLSTKIPGEPNLPQEASPIKILAPSCVSIEKFPPVRRTSGGFYPGLYPPLRPQLPILSHEISEKDKEEIFKVLGRTYAQDKSQTVSPEQLAVYSYALMDGMPGKPVLHETSPAHLRSLPLQKLPTRTRSAGSLCPSRSYDSSPAGSPIPTRVK